MTDYLIEKKIKTLSKKKGLSIRVLCQKIEVTENGLSKMFKNNSLKVETLQKIAEILEVDIREFFGGIGESEREKVLETEFKELKEKFTNEHEKLDEYQQKEFYINSLSEIYNKYSSSKILRIYGYIESAFNDIHFSYKINRKNIRYVRNLFFFFAISNKAIMSNFEKGIINYSEISELWINTIKNTEKVEEICNTFFEFMDGYTLEDNTSFYFEILSNDILPYLTKEFK